MAALTQLKALRLVECTVKPVEDGKMDSFTYKGPGHDMGALPGLTRLQSVSMLGKGLAELQGFVNMQQVLSHAGTLPFDLGNARAAARVHSVHSCAGDNLHSGASIHAVPASTQGGCWLWVCVKAKHCSACWQLWTWRQQQQPQLDTGSSVGTLCSKQRYLLQSSCSFVHNQRPLSPHNACHGLPPLVSRRCHMIHLW